MEDKKIFTTEEGRILEYALEEYAKTLGKIIDAKTVRDQDDEKIVNEMIEEMHTINHLIKKLDSMW